MKAKEEKIYIKRKDVFMKVLNLIQEYQTLENDFCNILETMSGGNTYVDAFIYSAYQDVILDMLHVLFQIPENDGILEWYIYDTNFGKDCKAELIIDGKTIDVSEPEALYNYLMDTYEW